MPVIYTRCVSVIDNDGNKVSKSMVTEKSGAGGRERRSRSLNIGRSPENCNVLDRGTKTKGNIFFFPLGIDKRDTDWSVLINLPSRLLV